MDEQLVRHVIQQLRSLSEAYPESIFRPLVIAETDDQYLKGIITRSSAAMGRHFAKLFVHMANDLERAVTVNASPDAKGD